MWFLSFFQESLVKLQEAQGKAASLEKDIASYQVEKVDLEKKFLDGETNSQHMLQKQRSDSLMKQLDILGSHVLLLCGKQGFAFVIVTGFTMVL